MDFGLKIVRRHSPKALCYCWVLIRGIGCQAYMYCSSQYSSSGAPGSSQRKGTCSSLLGWALEESLKKDRSTDFLWSRPSAANAVLARVSTRYPMEIPTNCTLRPRKRDVVWHHQAVWGLPNSPTREQEQNRNSQSLKLDCVTAAGPPPCPLPPSPAA